MIIENITKEQFLNILDTEHRISKKIYDSNFKKAPSKYIIELKDMYTIFTDMSNKNVDEYGYINILDLFHLEPIYYIENRQYSYHTLVNFISCIEWENYLNKESFSYYIIKALIHSDHKRIIKIKETLLEEEIIYSQITQKEIDLILLNV